MTKKKLENNWQSKRLENLEKDDWGEPPYDSYLVTRTHEIRKLPLAELTNDDIAMMLRQEFSLEYIVPLALDRLESAEKGYEIDDFEGAIIRAMVNLSSSFWQENKDYWSRVKKVIDENTIGWKLKREQFDNVHYSN